MIPACGADLVTFSFARRSSAHGKFSVDSAARDDAGGERCATGQRTEGEKVMNKPGFAVAIAAALLLGNNVALAGDRHHRDDYGRDHYGRDYGYEHYRGPKHVYHHHYHYYEPRRYRPRYYVPVPVYYTPPPVYYPAPRYGSGVSGTISVHF
jgi:hypothetical protein